MKKDKIIVRINNLQEISDYKKVGISNFLFALEEFSVGYPAYSLSELKKLPENVFLLVNRAFDKEALDDFIKIKDELNFVKGIFYEDIAVYQVLKNSNVPLFWNQMHAAVSSLSVNFWLNKVNSVVLANELTKEEIINILDKANKKVILPVFGLNIAMYSRRHLLSNYNKFKEFKNYQTAILKTGADTEFLAVENKYGTVFFYHRYFNLIREINSFDDDKIFFYYVDPNEVSFINMIDILNGKEVSYDNRFYEKKTIYKIGDDK